MGSRFAKSGKIMPAGFTFILRYVILWKKVDIDVNNRLVAVFTQSFWDIIYMNWLFPITWLVSHLYEINFYRLYVKYAQTWRCSRPVVFTCYNVVIYLFKVSNGNTRVMSDSNQKFSKTFQTTILNDKFDMKKAACIVICR